MANTYVLISSSTVGSGGASSIAFSSIPATYTDLLVKVSARSSQAATNDAAYCYFNGVSTNYSNLFVYGTGGAVGAVSSNTTGIYLAPINGDTSTANTFGNLEFYIPNYLSTTNTKSVNVDGVQETNASTSFMAFSSGLWSPGTQVAINSITIYPATGPNWLQYSTAYLYGIKKS
jgi:hypothetical protein